MKDCVNIPGYVLFDLDLNEHHLKLYCVIELIESFLKVKPKFSYKSMANFLKVEKSSAKKIAKVMKEKGYITHTITEGGDWVWSISILKK